MAPVYLWGLSLVDRFIAIASVQMDLTGEAGHAHSIACFQRVYGREHIASHYVELYKNLLGKQ